MYSRSYINPLSFGRIVQTGISVVTPAWYSICYSYMIIFLCELSDDQSHPTVLEPMLQLTRGHYRRCGTVCPTSDVFRLDLMNDQC